MHIDNVCGPRHTSSTIAVSWLWRTLARTRTSPSSSSRTRSNPTSTASTQSSGRYVDKDAISRTKPNAMIPYPRRVICHPLTQVIDGADSTLDAMERVPVNAKNRPLNEIRTTHVRAQLLPHRDRAPSVQPACHSPYAQRRGRRTPSRTSRTVYSESHGGLALL